MTMTRRTMIAATGAGLLGGLCLPWGGRGANAAPGRFEVAYSDAEWRRRLTPLQYRVLRQGVTERPWSSPLDREKRAGSFVCAASRCRFSRRAQITAVRLASFTADPDAVRTARTELLHDAVEVICGAAARLRPFEDGPPPGSVC